MNLIKEAQAPKAIDPFSEILNLASYGDGKTLLYDLNKITTDLQAEIEDCKKNIEELKILIKKDQGIVLETLLKERKEKAQTTIDSLENLLQHALKGPFTSPHQAHILLINLKNEKKNIFTHIDFLTPEDASLYQ